MSDSSKAENTRDPSSVVNSGPTGRAFAMVALLLALLALLAAGWANWQLQALRQLPARIGADGSRVIGLTRQLDTLAASSERQQQQLEDLSDSLDAGLAVLPELTARMQQSEQQLESLSATDAGTRNAWLKAEALYYLQVANTQATLAADSRTAAIALQFADDKLRDTGDPALTAVRAKLTADLAALKALPQVDRAGMALRLQAFASQAGSWPFRSTAPERFAPAVGSPETPADIPPWDRFIEILKAVFASIVSVKQTDARPLAQLGAEERALIVAGLQAELTLARLALADNDAKTFRQSLQQATAQVRQYFDPQAPAVTAALVAFTELQATELPGPLPDISGALTLLLSGADTASPGDAK